jgi:hypothetical protein
VEKNAFCSAGPTDGPEFNGRSGYGSLTENWLIRCYGHAHVGMTVSHTNNDLYESEMNVALGTGDNHNSLTVPKPKRKRVHLESPVCGRIQVSFCAAQLSTLN